MVVDTAIAKGWSVAWEGDVTETGFNYLKGLASLTGEDHNYDAERVANYKDESTERDHLMHIVGIAKDSVNNKWYYLKNSWGKYNVMSGFLFMQENYFKLKTVNLMVNKNALPKSIKAKLGLK
jgi:bleomycin hydrolase